MSVWDDLTGHGEAIALLRSAAGQPSGASSSAVMTHAWLITGPPGSGRSNLAYAFATALLSSGTPDRVNETRQQVGARTHPDLTSISTERVIISIDEVRHLVASSQYAPSVSRYRVMVIEDADRMTQRTSNVLLKALEEPPTRTVWILCAPSDADVIPTIRSRVRTVRLSVPSVSDVASLLQRRDGVDPEIAERSAREAQSHIGMARRLATFPEAREWRGETLRLVLGIRSVSAAVTSAARLLEIAGDDAKTITEEREAENRDAVLRSLGIEPGQPVPAALRAQIRNSEDEQKRRATRSLRDGLDRILVDLLSAYRDIVMIQLLNDPSLINRELEVELRHASSESSAEQTLTTIDAIMQARSRIAANVAPTLAVEAMLVSAIRKAA